MSKFSGLREAKVLDVQKSSDLDVQTSDIPTKVLGAKIGRPRRKEAKHRHPDYRQVTAYVRRETYAEVRARLFNHEREFSDLVQELLVQWLKH